MKIGDTCLQASVYEGKLEITEFHLRTIRARSKGGPKVAHWFPKIAGVTWGKVSKKHGDFGWLDKNNIGMFRVSRPVSSGKPYSNTRTAAIRADLADTRRALKVETDPEFIAEFTTAIDVLQRALKRATPKQA